MASLGDRQKYWYDAKIMKNEYVHVCNIPFVGAYGSY